MLTRAKKEELVKKLTEQIRTGKAMVFSDYTGTTVAKMKSLRDELRENGATFKITKKKLIELAFRNVGIDVDVKNMEGQIGVAISQKDEVSAAKILAKFAKANEKFKILDGILESKVISREEVIALSMLPSREGLLAQVVGTINAPVSGFVNVLAGNIRGLMTVLKGIADSK